MNIVRIKATSVLLLYSLLSVQVLFSAQSHAVEDMPLIILVTPKANSVLTPDSSFPLVLDITGSWASKQSVCNFEGEHFLNLQIAQLDAFGNSQVRKNLESSGTFQSYNFTAYNSEIKTEVLKNGLRCTYQVKVNSDGQWVTGNDYAQFTRTNDNLFGFIKNEKSSPIGDIKKILIAWSWRTQPNNKVLMSFDASAPSKPVVTIEGVVRGEEISYLKPFTVNVTMGKNITLISKYGNGKINILPQGNKCEEFLLIKETDALKIFQAKCILNSLTFKDRGNGLSASVDTEDGLSVSSEEVAVNIIKFGYPQGQWSVAGTYADDSKPGKGTKLQISMSFRFGITERLGYPFQLNSYLPNQKLRLCFDNSCQDYYLDSRGYLGIKKVLDGRKVYIDKTPYRATTICASSLFAGIEISAQFDNRISRCETVQLEEMPKPTISLKQGMPSGKVDKGSTTYKASFNFGRNFKKVSGANDSAASQCQMAQKYGAIKNYLGRLSSFGAQAEYIKSYLRTASGYQGCLDGFGK
jgi:hypothetical protein